MRTMILYGNCQVEFITDILSIDPVAANLFRYVYVRSYRHRNELPPPSESDFRDCAILCEQVDWKAFPYRDRLPKATKTVRFPPLDSSLLWPFNAVNLYDEADPPAFPDGRFPYGDRIILREIDRGMSAEEVLSFYLDGWDRYRVNVKRLRELELMRLRKRDDECDVAASDLVNDLSSEQLFWTISHPRKSLVAKLLERILSACSIHEPAFRYADVLQTIAKHPAVFPSLEAVEIPVHPRIAEELALEWYDPNASYRQYGGFTYTYAQYFEEMTRYCIENREKQRRGKMPITGANPGCSHHFMVRR